MSRSRGFDLEDLVRFMSFLPFFLSSSFCLGSETLISDLIHAVINFVFNLAKQDVIVQATLN